MPYVAPTAQDVRDRFSRFASLTDQQIDPALARSGRVVDDSWLSQEDYTEGRLLWTAHELTLEGLGGGLEAESATAGTLGLTSVRSGSLAFTRGSTGSSGGVAGAASTTYEQQFLQLARMNKGGARTTGD